MRTSLNARDPKELFRGALGVNIGKGQPLYANPFSSKSVPETVRDAGKEILRGSGEALERGGEALKEKAGADK
ncbi:MAG: hypothetical protein CVV10_07780 [Gammaproteobacteria bacterium HGW-Gammaproteobacteria-14]|nr:MAG: hypothetical protein CVV10_07780 [Gammaproteobacteria bacterium HGW-Gammaproteobacteria-14]